MNQLADHAANPATSPERQSSLDDHIRSRIQSELEHLRKDEDDVRKQIELALEKENLDRERTMAGGASEGDGASLAAVKSSVTLMGDLEEIRSKVDRFHSRRDLSEFPQVKADGEAVVLCYRCAASSSLAFLFFVLMLSSKSKPSDPPRLLGRSESVQGVCGQIRTGIF